MKISSKSPLDGGATFSKKNKLHRAAWNFTWLILCSWTPPALWKWRIFILKIFGASVSKRCDVRRNAKIWIPMNLKLGEGSLIAEKVVCYNVDKVELEERALVSQGASLCTASHDINTEDFRLVKKPILLRSYCWIASEAFVGPGVTVGEGAILGARGAAFNDLEAWTVYRGNPASPIKLRKKLIQ